MPQKLGAFEQSDGNYLVAKYMGESVQLRPSVLTRYRLLEMRRMSDEFYSFSEFVDCKVLSRQKVRSLN